MNVSSWILSVFYWFHMLATVVWIGGLATVSLLVLPAARRSLESPKYNEYLVNIQHRLDPLGWFCIVLLTGTGLLQMSVNPNYMGILDIGNRWSLAIFLKHLVFLMMVVISAIMTWGVAPKVQRSLLETRMATREKGNEEPQDLIDQKIIKQVSQLLNLNLILAILVLALTAIARVG